MGLKSIAMHLLLTLASRQARSFVHVPVAPSNAALRSFSVLSSHRSSISSKGRCRSGRSSSSRLSALAKDLSTLTVPELQGLLRTQGSKISGRKAELIQRLSASFEVESSFEVEVEPAERKNRKRKPTTRNPRTEKGRSTWDDIRRERTRIPVEPKQTILQTIAAKSAINTSGRSTQDDISALDAEFDSIFGSTEPDPTRTGIAAAEPAAAAATTVAAGGFSDMSLPQPVVRRLIQMGLTEPTPIQREAIPIALDAIDVMGLAQTGTGKTIAFGVPLVSKLLRRGKNGVTAVKPRGVAALVLAPTRELANQIAEQLRSLTEGSPVKTMVVVGGQNIQTQTNKLKGGTHILVATPGRLIDLMDRGALTLRDSGFLVLDEADMMLDMGFAPDLKRIVRQIPPKRQTMLFSATMNDNMADIARVYLREPVRVEVARAGKTADKITQELHYVAKPDKMGKLLSLLEKHGDPGERTLVFGRTKHGMEKLSKRLLHAGIKAGSIHGNKSQPQRDRAIRDFKSGAMNVLVATDVAARGLDIPDVRHVYNYELPNQPESYVHRIGRTARAGKDGAAIAFCSMEEMDDLAAIQTVVGIKIPVASGRPWSKRDSERAKDVIKERKQNQQEAYRKKKKNAQRRHR